MRIAIAIAVVVVASCGDSPNPVAPTVSPPSPTPSPLLPPPPSTIDIDFAFDAEFWQALVYNTYEYYANPEGSYPLSETISLVLPTTSPNFYIRRSTPDDTMPGCGRRWSLDRLSYMERMIPRLVEQLTGEPYRGQVISGCEDRQQAEWITIVAATAQERPDLGCARARVGAYGDGDVAGRIWFHEEKCTTSFFRKAFAHELGHAMGFWHVPPGSGDAMDPTPGRDDFSIRERQHARHAYKRGRHAPFCSDAMTCASRAFGFSQGRISLGTPPVLP